jgi:nucleoid-associated protein YgaU
MGLNGDARAPLPPASAGAVAPAATPLPAGTPAGASAPPITIPASRGPARPASRAPQVESYDEEEYRAKAGDTFQAISMQFYRTDRYAPALLLYNRSHPLGSLGVRQEPPVLQAGQPVFIPPTNILEKRHSAAVPDLTPLTPGRGAPIPERRSNASPGAAAGSPLQYRVPGEGEMMWEIARRTLQNGERWQEIHKLNPSLRPELRVAGGTVINLPADAQVDAANRL